MDWLGIVTVGVLLLNLMVFSVTCLMVRRTRQQHKELAALIEERRQRQEAWREHLIQEENRRG